MSIVGRAYNKEARLTGHLRNANTGSDGIHSEETRIVRSYSKRNVPNPWRSAEDYNDFHTRKNLHLAKLHTQNTHNNRKIIRPDLHQKRRLPQAPHPNSEWARILRNVPNATVERSFSTYPKENKFWEFRDRFGHAFAGPEQGRSYVWPNLNYFGNPWGAGGMLYQHLRQGGQQEDGYLAGKPKKGPEDAKQYMERRGAGGPYKKKKVHFQEAY